MSKARLVKFYCSFLPVTEFAAVSAVLLFCLCLCCKSGHIEPFARYELKNWFPIHSGNDIEEEKKKVRSKGCVV